VHLLQGRRAQATYRIALLEDMPVEEPEEKPEFGCFLALMPGVIAAGSTPEILGDTIRRLKGKSASPSLATLPAFRGAAALRNRPGLFAWTDPPRLTRLINDALQRDLIRRKAEVQQQPRAKGEKPNPIAEAKRREAARHEVEAQHRHETREWTLFQKVANPAGMRHFTAACSLHEGAFACRVEARMKDKQSSPLLELLPSERIGPDLLQAVPSDAFCLFALPLPHGPAALTRLLKLADAFSALQDDQMRRPSKILRELETRMRLHLGRDVLAKINSAAVAVHLVGQPAKEAGIYPLFVIEAINEDAARDLEFAWPRLHTMSGKATEPRRH